jgi:hypothetical protein
MSVKKSILDAARVIRSKNSGPFELTLDIIFKDRGTYEFFKTRKLINPALVAKLYKIPVTDILGIVWFEPANAVKMTIRRPLSSGAPGESDIYGAQQHAPLLAIEYETD